MKNSVYHNFLKKNESSLNDILIVDQNENFSFEDLKRLSPDLPKPWFELSKLSLEERKEFILEFWLKTLPFDVKFSKKLCRFFSKVENILLSLSKGRHQQYYSPELIYCHEKVFFRGRPFISKESSQLINFVFENQLPKDFLSFFQIHNGFAKGTDTGIIALDKLKSFSRQFITHFSETFNQNEDPSLLIPFYQCNGRSAFQCFHLDWRPKGDSGNLFISSDGSSSKNGDLSFFSFLDWFSFYLEEPCI